jgi:low temperature requirement protein LtrA
MVAGIIVAAAADAATADLVARDGAARAPAWAAWLILAGPALFLAGHAAFKAVIWRRPSWSRLGAIAALGLLGLARVFVPQAAALVLAGCAAAAVAAVAVADQIWRPAPADD